MPADSPGTSTAENSDGKAELKYLLTLPSASEEGEAAAETGSITFVGTATVIIRFGGLTILTDPNFLHKPAIELANLPPIDLIVLSHMHEDHFDRFVQKNLDREFPFITMTMTYSSLP